MNHTSASLPVLVCTTFALWACSDDDRGVMRLEAQVNVPTANESCYATVARTPETVHAGLRNGSCSEDTTAELIGGGSQLRVLTDYGIDFDEGAAAPTSTLKLFVDGLEHGSGPAGKDVGDDSRWGMSFVFPLPTVPDGRLSIRVATADGYAGELDVGVLQSPDMEVTATQCPMVNSSCDFTAGVGFAQLAVDVEGPLEREVELIQRVDGLEQVPTTRKTQLSMGDRVRALFDLPVPFARKWALTARTDNGESSPVEFDLAAPVPSAELSCGDACVLKSGTKTTLTVTVPLKLSATQGTVTTKLGGNSDLVDGTISLGILDNNTDTKFGLLPLTAPTVSTEATWQIDVRVAGYRANTILATVTPK